MAPKYKLTYFNRSGRAEHIRYIFAYAQQDFEDIRIKREQWPELKPKTPFGKLPLLEFDGKSYNQSDAIARYLAKQFGLTGKDDLEDLEINAIVDTFGDFKTALMKRFLESDEQKRAEGKKEEAFYLQKIDKIISENPSGFLVGSKVTWADFAVVALLSDMQVNFPELVKPYPGLAKLIEKVNSIPSIKAYREKRPASDPPPPQRK